jgi:hypothetical protein
LPFVLGYGTAWSDRVPGQPGDQVPASPGIDWP